MGLFDRIKQITHKKEIEEQEKKEKKRWNAAYENIKKTELPGQIITYFQMGQDFKRRGIDNRSDECFKAASTAAHEYDVAVNDFYKDNPEQLSEKDMRLAHNISDKVEMIFVGFRGTGPRPGDKKMTAVLDYIKRKHDKLYEMDKKTKAYEKNKSKTYEK